MRVGEWTGWGGRYGPAGMHRSPLEGQLPSEAAPAWPSLYGLLRDFVVENKQLRYGGTHRAREQGLKELAGQPEPPAGQPPCHPASQNPPGAGQGSEVCRRLPMPSPAPSPLPRQPRLSPDPGSDVPAGPACRVTRSSCDSWPLLRSTRVPPGHPVRLQQPDVTPTSGPWLPVSVGVPSSTGSPVGGCAHGRVRMHKPPARCSLPSCRSCLPPLAAPAAPSAAPGQPMPPRPMYGPGGLFRAGGHSTASSLTALLAPRHCQSPLREVPASCHPARRTRLCPAPVSSPGTPTRLRGSGESQGLGPHSGHQKGLWGALGQWVGVCSHVLTAGAGAGAGAHLSGTPGSCQAPSAAPAPRQGSSLRHRRGRDCRSPEVSGVAGGTLGSASDGVPRGWAPIPSPATRAWGCGPDPGDAGDLTPRLPAGSRWCRPSLPVGRGTGLAGGADLSSLSHSRAVDGASGRDLAQPTHGHYTWGDDQSDLGLQGPHRPRDGWTDGQPAGRSQFISA